MMMRSLCHDHRPQRLDDNRRGEVLLRYPLRENRRNRRLEERPDRGLVKGPNRSVVEDRRSGRDGKGGSRRGYRDPEAGVLRLGRERDHSECRSHQ
jgi:hypothetical protein